MAARRRRRRGRGARCPLDRRARRETPRSERPAVAGDAATGTGCCSVSARARRAPCPRRAANLSSPSRYIDSSPFLLFDRGDARRRDCHSHAVSSADAPGGTAARVLTHKDVFGSRRRSERFIFQARSCFPSPQQCRDAAFCASFQDRWLMKN